MRSKCGRANQDKLRHEAHAVYSQGVRADWSDSTRPSSEFTVFHPAPNGERYRQRVGGTQADLPDIHPSQTRQFASPYPLSGARCVGLILCHNYHTVATLK